MRYIFSLVLVAVLFACGGDEVTPPKSNLSEGVGAICGSSEILGTVEKGFGNSSCGISNPVKVYAVSGVKLSQPALLNCGAAQALNKWAKRSLQPSAVLLNKQVTEMQIMGSYVCRTRNHRKGAKISEHAKGNAVDIGGFTFSDGSKSSLLNDYYGPVYGGFLKKIRGGACGTFGTVLGPGTDRLHANHFHFDTARYSMGAYCR